MDRPIPGDDGIVVIANSSPSATTFLRSLGRRGIRTIVASEDPSVPAFRSRYCGESVIVPSPDEDLRDYRDALLSLARRPDVRTIAPLREEDIYVLAKHRPAFADHVSTPWPTLETLEYAHDRVRLFDAAAEAGVPMPTTRLLDDVSDWDRELIVKARFAILTAAYDDAIDPGTLRSPPKTTYLTPGEEPNTAAIRADMEHEPIVQEYVSGTEYTFRGLFDRGRPIVTAQKRLVRGMKYPRGPSVFHEAVDEPGLEAAGLTLLDHLDWSGPASVGFMEDEETGEFKLLEINPRFWASIPVDVHAGVDFPYYYWCLASDAAEFEDPQYRTGTASHRLLGEVSYLYSVLRDEYPLVDPPPFLRAVGAVATSLLAQPRLDHLSLTDPAPFVQELRNNFGTRERRDPQPSQPVGAREAEVTPTVPERPDR